MQVLHQQLRFSLSMIGAAVVAAMVAGCGGGGVDTANATDPTLVHHQDLAVRVIDGPIQNALVCLDLNDSGACDAEEPQGLTDADGRVVLSVAVADAGRVPVIAEVGTDAVDRDSGPVTMAYRMVAPADYPGLVSPLTTMVYAQTLATGSHSAQAAVAVQQQTGVADALADYSDAAAAPADAELARAVAGALVAALQQQAITMAGTVVHGDAEPTVLSGAALAQAGLAAVHRELPAIIETVRSTLRLAIAAPDARALVMPK